jgi:O-acetyl-ADP-ribose deacetylase (regulator of RNase III)
MSLEYRKGDATLTQFDKTMIVHCCNDIGAWGAGFVVPLGNQFPRAKKMYKDWFAKKKMSDDMGRVIPFELGEAQFVKVGTDTFVVNLIGQRGIFESNRDVPVRYDAIRKGLQTVASRALVAGYSVQMPKMGAGLARGDWDTIESIIKEELSSNVETLVLLTDTKTGSWLRT